ncbi:MAG TPA: hypothetical protein V6C63_17720 [Allocoleopsis sp.]
MSRHHSKTAFDILSLALLHPALPSMLDIVEVPGLSLDGTS